MSTRQMHSKTVTTYEEWRHGNGTGSPGAWVNARRETREEEYEVEVADVEEIKPPTYRPSWDDGHGN